VIRVKLVLAVAEGANYTEAAHRVGRQSGEAVSQLVARFNVEGLQAIEPRHGGGPAEQYGKNERERVLAEMRRAPDRECDGTATWSLSTLQRVLRQGQFDRTPIPRLASLVFSARHLAVVYACERQLVEYGGVEPAYYLAARLSRAVSSSGSHDYRVA
jgi:hypothetical protein